MWYLLKKILKAFSAKISNQMKAFFKNGLNYFKFSLISGGPEVLEEPLAPVSLFLSALTFN